MGQAIAVDGHVVNWDPGQCESTASPRVPGVRVQRQTHDEEANHREGDGEDQGHLWVYQKERRSARCTVTTENAAQVWHNNHGQSNLERSRVEREAIAMDEHPQGCQGDEEPASKGGEVDELVDLSSD